MKRLIRIILVIAFSSTIFWGTTVSAKTSNGDPGTEALVFGCFDLTEIKSFLTNVTFYSYPAEIKLRQGYQGDIKMFDMYHGGLYIADRVKPGQYWLKAIATMKYGYSLNPKETYSDINYQPAESDVFTVKAGDIYFYGTYKYRVVEKAKLFSSAKFSLEKIETPGEKELLQLVLEKMKGSKWEAKIQERLANL